jgi:DNA repair exonuclease SbcCD nuclease subunit
MIIFAADLHLRMAIWSKHPDISGDHAIAWRDLVRAVVSNPGSSLILGGDIFHNTTPSGEVENLFRLGMNSMLGRGHHVYYITGNHDDEPVPRPALFGAERLEDGVVYNVDGVKVVGINHIRNTEALQEALTSVPPCDLLIMHTAFQHTLGFADMWQCTEEDVPEHVGAVLVGHIHKHIEKGRIYSPGSICVNSISEIDPADHGYYMVDKGKVTWKQLDGRVFKSIDLDDKTEGTLTSIAKNKRALPPVVNLSFPRSEEDRVDDLMKRFSGIQFLKNARSVEITEALVPTEQEGIDLDAVVSNALATLLADNQPARNLASALITEPDPAKVLEDFLKETT